MRKRSNTSGVPETAKQRRTQAKIVRARARILAFCNTLAFWQICDVAACRRNHSCRGNAHACFTRHWRAVPDDELALVREYIDARRRQTDRISQRPNAR